MMDVILVERKGLILSVRAAGFLLVCGLCTYPIEKVNGKVSGNSTAAHFSLVPTRFVH